jgi:hypothetical protein
MNFDPSRRPPHFDWQLDRWKIAFLLLLLLLLLLVALFGLDSPSDAQAQLHVFQAVYAHFNPC